MMSPHWPGSHSIQVTSLLVHQFLKV
uniref:Uncharacterized protein n=1 Tax=Amphimedon queenslandica TaxID=400682 RepID=A0A1X7TYX3_AMPQE